VNELLEPLSGKRLRLNILKMKREPSNSLRTKREPGKKEAFPIPIQILTHEESLSDCDTARLFQIGICVENPVTFTILAESRLWNA
jgi:hypothetical protein